MIDDTAWTNEASMRILDFKRRLVHIPKQFQLKDAVGVCAFFFAVVLSPGFGRQMAGNCSCTPLSLSPFPAHLFSAVVAGNRRDFHATSAATRRPPAAAPSPFSPAKPSWQYARQIDAAAKPEAAKRTNRDRRTDDGCLRTAVKSGAKYPRDEGRNFNSAVLGHFLYFGLEKNRLTLSVHPSH